MGLSITATSGTETFTDFNLDPPKPHTELVTRQGNRVYVVKWTPKLPRPDQRRRLETSHWAAPGEGHSSSTSGSSRR
jgi:hypothetical protein